MAKSWSAQATDGVATKPPEVETYNWKREPGIDPYFRWALHTNWRGFSRLAGWDLEGANKPPEQIRIIASLCDADASAEQVAKRLAELKGFAGIFEVPASYDGPIPGTQVRARHVTATVALNQARWLLDNPLGLRWKLAMPMRDANRVAQASADGLYGTADRDPRDFQSRNVVADELKARDRSEPEALPGAIALIDHGCPFLNMVFQEPGGTRVASIWDQGAGLPPPGDPPQVDLSWPWDQPGQFDYGRELRPSALDAMALAVRDRGDIDESMVYRGVDHLIDYDDARRRIWFATHGGHLMHVAAGNPDPLTGEIADAATGAPIVFVQLPLHAAMDSGGASLSPHILDGVRYAMSRVPAGSPLVVSISFGGQAGPHDGSSLIEEALEELLVQRRDNFAVVLAAGNARLARAHASRMLRAERSVLLRCEMPTGDTTDSFVELWYDEPQDGSQLEFRVRTPSQVWSPWVADGKEVVYREKGFGPIAAPNAAALARALDAEQAAAGQEVVALLRHDRHVPNGRRSLALLALAPTAKPADVVSPLAEAGTWEIEARLVPPAGHAAQPVRIHAWIERDDPGLHGGHTRPYFLDQLPDDELDTMSSLANNDNCLRAGGFNRGTGRAAPYSALGSRDRLGSGPDVLAVCEEDEDQTSIAATATRSGEICRLNGTSVAAPVLARRLYNLMAMGNVTREDWPALLRALAEDPQASCIRAPRTDD